MVNKRGWGVLLVLLLWLPGCSMNGRLFTSVVAPLTQNYNNTPLGSKRCVIKNHRLREPVSRLNVSAEWTTSEIAAEARKAGIAKIHYLDIRTFSLLTGIYRRQDIIIYGD
ncbi:TRL domain-containing protein [Thermodesulfobacteriota bacterium]